MVRSTGKTGIGIPSKRLHRLFEMFSQADTSMSRRYGGSGLGLAICRRLCERMGGTIDVESRGGRGATFTIRLPFGVPRGEEAARSADATRSAHAVDAKFAASLPLDILVVDDSGVGRDVAVALLGALGYRADSAASGRGAVARVRRKRYDLVLLDMHMPGLDGLQTARAIRQVARRPAPRIVALTADVFVRDVGDARRALDAVLTKPLELRVLAALLTTLPRRPAVPTMSAEVLDDMASQADSAGRSLLTAFVPRIRREGERLLAAIAVAARRGDADRLARVAHALRGLALSFGATELARQAGDLTVSIALHRVRDLRALFDEAMEALERRA